MTTNKTVNKTTTTNKEVLPVIPMFTFTGLNFEGKEVTVKTPMGFIYLGATFTGNVNREFAFRGNPDNKNRQGFKRDLQFKVVLQQEVNVINQMEILDKYILTALMRTNLKNIKGTMTVGKEVIAVNIMGKDGNCYGNMLDVASAIDTIGVLMHVQDWKQAHAIYKVLSGRDNKKSKYQAPCHIMTDEENASLLVV